jgi:hypothetical protein
LWVSSSPPLRQVEVAAEEAARVGDIEPLVVVQGAGWPGPTSPLAVETRSRIGIDLDEAMRAEGTRTPTACGHEDLNPVHDLHVITPFRRSRQMGRPDVDVHLKGG